MRLEVVCVLILCFGVLGTIAQTDLCDAALLNSEREAGYYKFSDPDGCSIYSDGCDVLGCRLCKLKGNTELIVTDDIAYLPLSYNVTCPRPTTHVILTAAQETARQQIGISYDQMISVLSSVNGCTVPSNDENGISESQLHQLSMFCESFLTQAHASNGVSAYFSRECIGQPGCNAALLVHNQRGGCRYCRVPNTDCINDCDMSWPTCPNTR